MQRRDLLKISTILIGATVSSSVSRAVMAGIKPGSGAAGRFTDEQAEAVTLLADMIIPATDTPGAVEAGVPDFIASIVFDWYRPGEREIFMQGLDALDKACINAVAKPFRLADEATRIQALEEQERIASEYQGPPPVRLARPPEDINAPFFNRIKELVVIGYYTSEVGATTELIYAPVPGRYDGQVDFSSVGQQWSS